MRLVDARSWPIRWWLTALNVGVLVATLLLLGGLFLSQVENALLGIAADHLKEQTRAVVDFQQRRPPPQGGEPHPAPPPIGSQPGGPLLGGPPPGEFPPAQPGGPFRSGSPPGELPPGPQPGGPFRGGPPAGEFPPGQPGEFRGGPPGFSASAAAGSIVAGLRGPDTGAQVFGRGGELIAASEANEAVEAWPTAPRDKLSQALSGSEQTVVISQQTRRTLMLLLPFRGPDGTQIGVVQTTRALDLTDQLAARLRIALLVGTLLAAVIAGLVGFRATRAALRPLDRVIAAARQIGAGAMDERLRLGRRGQIGELAEAFDTMLDRLAAALNAQKRFVADAAHELRTPLTALGGVVEMLQLGADRGDPATVQRLLGAMDREIGRLTRLVSGLLALSRLDAEQPLALAPVNLAALLSDVADQTRLLSQGQEVSCSIESAPTVLGDGDRLKQAILNLGANALAATSAGERVEFRLSGAIGSARVVVADTGAGIDPNLLPRVMERFVRGDPSRSSETGGSGLGLAIAQGIVQAHGGTIALESQLGQGTRAIIDLPLDGQRSPGSGTR